MLRGITRLLLVLFVVTACSRSHPEQPRKTYAYVSDFPAGHIILSHDLSATTYDTASVEDVLPAQARKDFTRDFITDSQLQEVLGRPLVHEVHHGSKLRLDDFQAPSSATPGI